MITEDFSFHILRVLIENDIDSSRKKWWCVSKEFPYFVSIPQFSIIFKITGQYPVCIFRVIPVTDGNFVEAD
jgi:hypothetical protein